MTLWGGGGSPFSTPEPPVLQPHLNTNCGSELYVFVVSPFTSSAQGLHNFVPMATLWQSLDLCSLFISGFTTSNCIYSKRSW